MQPIAVIGVSGFVGSHVARALSRRETPVVGLLRQPDRDRPWIEAKVAVNGPVELRAADLTDPNSLTAALEGCSGIVMSAGVEAQTPNTVALMLGAAAHTLDAAESLGIDRVVFTSSTGSTNPPGPEPALKREADAWSDPIQQLAVGKFSPAAKTLMDRLVLARMARSEGALRVATLNPSMIVGDSLSGEAPGVLRFLAAILAGDRFAQGAPDGSMSMIHADDLAALHLAALDSPEARGRYFGVVQSWHWQDILEALARVAPTYQAPTWPADRPRARPTTFDLTRRDSLGVELRGLDAMLEDAVDALSRRGMLPGS